MRAQVQTAHGVYLVDLDEEEVLELDAALAGAAAG